MLVPIKDGVVIYIDQNIKLYRKVTTYKQLLQDSDEDHKTLV